MFFIKRIKNNYNDLTKKTYDNIEKTAILKKELDEVKSVQKELRENANFLDKKRVEMLHDYLVLEYKYYQNNNALNKLLYNQQLEINKLKGKVKKRFKPLVSIIIPVYNGSDYLSKAIDCALSQDYDKVEVIVVNDGSTDKGKSAKAAKKYGEKIRYFEKENGGVSSALNYGIKKMNGDYFVWLSHDDLISADHVSKHIEYLKNTDKENVITYTNFEIVDENGNIKLKDSLIAALHCYDYKMSEVYHYNCILQGEVNGGSIMIPKKAFDKYGLFNEKERITQEKDMWARLLKGYTFINIPYTTSFIRSHSKQVTNTNPNIAIETNKKLKEIISNISEEEMIRDYGSVANFYLFLAQHYKNNYLDEMYSFAIKKYEESKNKNS